jgi:hypothetical protein
VSTTCQRACERKPPGHQGDKPHFVLEILPAISIHNIFEMASREPCPVRELEVELGAYINSRQQTLKIRQALSRHLVANVKSADPAAANQHLNYACPQALSVHTRRTQECSAEQLRFLQALESNFKAKLRLEKSKGGMQQIREQSLLEESGPTGSDHDSAVTREYISLLGQRQRYAELQVVERSLDKLLNAELPDSHIDPVILVKNSVGEQPSLPAERLDLLSPESDENRTIFKLKKEVIEASSRVERAKSANETAQSRGQNHYSLAQQVYALGCARDEMVAWMEGELAKLTEESELLEDTSPLKRPAPRDDGSNAQKPEDRIRDSYDGYVASRAAAIQAQVSIQQPVQTHSLLRADSAGSGTTTGASSLSAPLAVNRNALALVTNLQQISGIERSLLQHGVYFQAQIAGANSQLQEALTRLAEESHLLGTQSNDPQTWMDTARQTEDNIRESTEIKLHASRQEVERVKGIVDLCSLHSRFLEATAKS